MGTVLDISFVILSCVLSPKVTLINPRHTCAARVTVVVCVSVCVSVC